MVIWDMARRFFRVKVPSPAGDLGAVRSDDHVALDQDGAHSLLFCHQGQIHVIHDPGKNVGRRMNVNVNRPLQQSLNPFFKSQHGSLLLQ
jgi:hypothetical protein